MKEALLKEDLLSKIRDHRAVIAVVGLGYVGLPLVVAFAERGFSVIGIDVDGRKIGALSRGESYVQDIPSARLQAILPRFHATTDYVALAGCDAAIICVPTPLNKTRDPDVRYLIAAGESIAGHIHPGMLVVLESTTYPGTTEELLLPMLTGPETLERLERTSFTVGEDFFLAFSPERIDPGNQKYVVENTPKVVGGMTPACREVAVALYAEAIERIVPVSSTQTAEMVKLLENTFRAVNIALVNEVAIMCDKLGIDVWEVIDAAATKPYGFMKFTPGPGVGGHCLEGQELVRYRWGSENSVSTLSALFGRVKQASARTFEHWGGSFVAPHDLEVLSVDPLTGCQSWQPVTYLFERAYVGRLVRIETQDHRRLTVTDHHPMLVHEFGGLATRDAIDLRVGDYLPLVNSIDEQTPAEPALIKVIDLLPADLAEHVRVRHPQGWAHAADVLRSMIGERGHDAIRYNSLALPVWRALPVDLQGPRDELVLVTGRGPASSSFPATLTVDESFARFLGYYLAEGCISEWKGRPRLRLTFNRAEVDYLADVQALLARWNVRVSEYNDPHWQTTTLKVTGWLLPWLLRDILQTGVSSPTMRVPDQLMAAETSIRRQLLIGLFRGDGDVHVRAGTRTYHKNGRTYEHQDNAGTVGFFSSSPQLFEQVTLLLQELGLTPTRKADKPQLRFHASSDLARLDDWFMGAKAERLQDLEANKRRHTTTRRPKADVSYALTTVKQVIPFEDQARVYSIEVEGTHTFAASSGIYVHNCIPLDPHYLSWKLKTLNYNARFIQLAGEINSDMPRYWVDKVQDALNGAGKPLKGSRVLVLGVAYKRDIDDVRESPALDIIELLRAKGAQVSYHDPYVASLTHNGRGLSTEPDLDAAILGADCVVIVTDHSVYNWSDILRRAALVVDTRNVKP